MNLVILMIIALNSHSNVNNPLLGGVDGGGLVHLVRHRRQNHQRLSLMVTLITPIIYPTLSLLNT